MILIFFSIIASSDLYNHANAEYESGNYYQAIDLYEKAGQETKNANIYYNLGNAYFKTRQTGMAIKNYRLAYFLAPRDPDVKHNLLYARTFRVDKIHVSVNPIAIMIDRIFRSISLYQAQVLSAVIIILIAIFIAGYIVFRRRSFLYITFGLALLALFCFMTWASWSSEKNRQPAVVIVPEASTLSGPAEDYREIVKVHDGMEANIRDERSGYYLIQLPGGIGGWIRKDAVIRIF